MPAAVVSANAFDRRLDNPVGLPSEDFIVKPVRLAELLDWLGRRLNLQWTVIERATAAAAPAAGDERVPPAPRLRALQQAVSLGHVRGIGQQLEQPRDLGQAVGKAHRPHFERELAGLDAGDVQRAFDQPEQVVAAAADHAHRLTPMGGHRIVLLQQLGIPEDAVERRAPERERQRQ